MIACLFTRVLVLKLFNKCEHVIFSFVLSEHGKKIDIAIFCQCHTQSVINVICFNETAEIEGCIIMKHVELYMISASTE